MLKTRKKWISILLTLVMLVGLMVPLAPAAMASTNYRALKVPSVLDGDDQTLGSVIIEVDGGTLKGTNNGANDTVNLKLPSDFKVGSTAGYDAVGNYVYLKDGTTPRVNVTLPNSISGKVNELNPDGSNPVNVSQYIELIPISDEEFQLKVKDVPSSGGVTTDAAIIKIEFPHVYVDSGFSGDITLTASAPSTSGFMSGSVVIGQVVSGDRKVELAVTNVPSFSSDTKGDPIKIRVTERKPSALDSGSESLKFKLPSEFKWIKDDFDINELWGDQVFWKVDGTLSDAADRPSNPTSPYTHAIGLEFSGFGDDELKVTLKVWDPEKDVNIDTNNDGTADITKGGWVLKTKGRDGTYEETAFELVLNIEVDDEKDAQVGDVVVSTSGSKSDVSPSELTVATYGQYEATAEAGDAPTIYAGQIDAQIGDVVIKESIANSLVDGRTILLTLPEWAKWRKIDTDSDNGVTLDFSGFPGTDGRTAKWTVKASDNNRSDAATLKLEKMEVAIRPGVTGDLTIEVGGTAGVSGTITVAKVGIPATMEYAGSPVQVKLGSTVNIGDVLIKETNPGSIDDDKNLILDLPEGVRFVGTPTVTVEEGNIALLTQDVRTQNDSGTDDNQVVIPVDSKSSKASTIRVSNIKIAADRTVPEGDIVLKLKGSAVAASIDTNEIKDKYSDDGTYFEVDGKDAFSYSTYNNTLFPGYSTTAKVTVAKAVAPGETKATAKFVIGSTTYSVNGVEATMDVAAYTKDGRTYLPVRYVAYALGITPENVLWDGSKATFIGNGRVVQVTPGSNILSINGAPVTMDVVTEVVNGRVMVPFRWVAQAFGAQVDWDEATQTVTMNL